MLIILGESASRKSTIEKFLVEYYGYKKLVTYTTRAIRPGEVDGVDYHYITDEKFKELDDNNFFAEKAVYNGWSYGTATEDCTEDKVAVLPPHGFRQLKKSGSLNIFSVYIKVDRRSRFMSILNRGDDIEEAYRRNLSDVGMFDGIEDEVDSVINNEFFKKESLPMADLVQDKHYRHKMELYRKGKVHETKD